MIVENLKASILQKIFEGKATKTYETDKNVVDSIKIIEEQKQELIEKYNYRKEPIYNPVTKEEELFEIPETWRWYRIGQLGIFKKGPFGSALTKSIFVKKGENTIKVYEQKNAIQKDITLGDYYISEKYFEEKMKSFEVSKGDILVSCAGTIGETFIVPDNFEKGIINQALMRMTMVKEINVKYFLGYFDFILKKISNKLSNGSAIKNIPPFEVFKQLIIPLPPIEEQQRIVEKIEKIMFKLNELKNIENQLNITKKRFIEDINNSVLRSACSGNLSEQFKNENSTDIINKIQEEFSIHFGEVKNKPFDLPQNWKWVMFGDLVDFNIGKTPARSDFRYWSNGKYPWVSISDMNQGQILTETKEMVSEFAYNETFKGNISKAGTLIMSFKLTIGTCSILGMDAFHNEGIISIYPRINNEITKQYLLRILPYISNLGDTKGAIKGNTLNKTSLSNLPIPLPPLEEQKRIISKIEKLLPLLKEVGDMF